MLFTVFRLKPNRKLFLTFACIATTATKGDIFSGYYFDIIDYMLPTRSSFFRYFSWSELNSTINTRLISVSNFFLQPGRYVPIICHLSVS